LAVREKNDRGGAVLDPTPNFSVGVPQQLGGFSTLSDGLDYAARGETGFNFYSGRGELEQVLTYCELRLRALRIARILIAAGLKRLDRVAVVASTTPEFMAVFFGCQYAGLVPCPMPYSVHIGGKDAYVVRIAGMLASAGAAIAIVPDDLQAALGEAATQAGGIPVWTFSALSQMPDRRVDLGPLRAEEAAYIQYSSGSTSSPKGVLISQRAITANAEGILRSGLKIVPGDRAFSWLPLYHDMGLVGFCLAPMLGQASIDYLATAAFARRPGLWLKLIAQNRCTVSFSPSFGYDLAARRINGDARSLDLSCWRVAGIGGDMVRADVLDLFADKLGPAGFNPQAFLPCYGMAEATLAVSFADVERPVRVDTVDRARSKLTRRAVPAGERVRQNRERVRNFVVCGAPLPGHEVAVRDRNGRVLGEREIGRIYFRGPSMMTGYFEHDDATRAAFTDDGFMDTGDMGYWLDGEIVITGRAKDLILHNGRNIWPEDLEWAAERIEPLRDGDAAAFAVEGAKGEDDVVVLIQCRSTNSDEMEELRRKVAQTVHRTSGIECTIVLVPSRSLPFTSSGKLSRAAAKLGYLSGEIAEISPAEMRVPAAIEGAGLAAAE
jgi:fatty-acyl-CoA synthase